MRLVTLLAVLVWCSPFYAADPALEEKSELGGKVTLLIPKAFKPMSEEMLKIKYPSERRPDLVYTNERGSVNIALNHTKNRMPANQIPAFHRSLEATFKKIHPSAEWFRSEVSKINGRQFIVLEMRTPAIDTQIRNIMLGTSMDERLLLISFNVTKELEKEWLPVGKKVVESVKIK